MCPIAINPPPQGITSSIVLSLGSVRRAEIKTPFSFVFHFLTIRKVLKNIFTDFSDDALRKIFKTFDSDIDNAVNAIKRGHGFR